LLLLLLFIVCCLLFVVLSLRALGRLDDIVRILRHDVIILIGTRWFNDIDTLCQFGTVAGYMMYKWGHTTGGNRHAGVAILLRARRFSRASITQVYSPADRLVRGRFGALRIKAGIYDTIFCHAHQMPCTTLQLHR